MIWKLKNAQYILSIISHLFQLIPRVLWLTEFNKLNLVELMLSDKTTGITSGTASLGSIASGICTIFLSKGGTIKYFLTMIVGSWNLCSWNHVIVQPLQLKHILSKLRKLASTNHAICIYNTWSQHLLITMLVSMQVHHKAYKSALQTGTQSLVEGKTSTCNLRSTFSIYNIQISTQIPMSFWFKIKLSRLHEFSYFRVIGIVNTIRNIILWHIRNMQHNILKAFLHSFQLGIQLGDFFTNRLHFCYYGICIFSCLLHGTNLLGYGVTLCLKGFYFSQDLTTGLLQVSESI